MSTHLSDATAVHLRLVTMDLNLKNRTLQEMEASQAAVGSSASPSLLSPSSWFGGDSSKKKSAPNTPKPSPPPSLRKALSLGHLASPPSTKRGSKIATDSLEGDEPDLELSLHGTLLHPMHFPFQSQQRDEDAESVAQSEAPSSVSSIGDVLHSRANSFFGGGADKEATSGGAADEGDDVENGDPFRGLYEHAATCLRMKKVKEAIEAFQTLAQGGHVESQYELGRCFDIGFGVDRDMKKAVEWYTHAANANVGPFEMLLFVYLFVLWLCLLSFSLIIHAIPFSHARYLSKLLIPVPFILLALARSCSHLLM